MGCRSALEIDACVRPPTHVASSPILSGNRPWALLFTMFSDSVNQSGPSTLGSAIRVRSADNSAILSQSENNTLMKTRKALPSYMSTTTCFLLLSQISRAAQNLESEIAFVSVDPSIAGDLSAGAVLGGEPGTSTGSPVSADPKTELPWQPDPNKLNIAIYPIYGWAPIFGAHVNIPNTPFTPAGGSGSTDSSLNGAAMAGFSIQKKKSYGDLAFM